MPRRSKIRWRQSDEERLARTVRNFNAKVRRMEKKAQAEEKRIFEETGQRVGIVVPERVSLRDLKKGRVTTDVTGKVLRTEPIITTRQDLNREIRRMERFLKRGSEAVIELPEYDNIYISQWQKREMAIMQRQINKERNATRRKLAELEATLGGEELGYSVLEAHRAIGTGTTIEQSYAPVEAFPKPWKSRQGEIGYAKTSLGKRFASFQRMTASGYTDAKARRLKENYITAIMRGYGLSDETIKKILSGDETAPDYIKEVIDVIQKIREMDVDDFLDTYYAEGGSVLFEWAYPQEGTNEVTIAGQTVESSANMLGEIWL